MCTNFGDGDTEAYLIHVGEGLDMRSHNEWSTFEGLAGGCLVAQQTTITHGTAFKKAEFDKMAAAGMGLTWSPASNVALYGDTTDIPTALASGLTISLAPDWSMGGSQNLLDELRFAQVWDDARFGDVLSAKDLVRMVTSDAAKVIALDDMLGKIEVGHMADLMVIGGDPMKPYESIVAARPKDVRLVTVGGVVLFGDDQLIDSGPATPGCETVTVCGRDKFICVAEDTSSNLLDQSLMEIEMVLGNALTLLDGLTPLADSECGGCAADEECYPRTRFPVVAESNCPAPCAADENCYRKAMSGNNQYECRTKNACAPQKSQKQMAPLPPLVECN